MTFTTGLEWFAIWVKFHKNAIRAGSFRILQLAILGLGFWTIYNFPNWKVSRSIPVIIPIIWKFSLPRGNKIYIYGTQITQDVQMLNKNICKVFSLHWWKMCYYFSFKQAFFILLWPSIHSSIIFILFYSTIFTKLFNMGFLKQKVSLLVQTLLYRIQILQITLVPVGKQQMEELGTQQ